jgi:hypothetical protein
MTESDKITLSVPEGMTEADIIGLAYALKTKPSEALKTTPHYKNGLACSHWQPPIVVKGRWVEGYCMVYDCGCVTATTNGEGAPRYLRL